MPVGFNPITTSRYGVATDALVAVLTSTPSLADPVQVFDGPAETGEDWKDAIFVGFDGDWQHGNYESAAIQQAMMYLGNSSRGETMDVRCCAISWSGDAKPKTLRDRALALLAAVEAQVRSDQTIGIDASTTATVTVGSAFQEPYRGGLQCRIEFTVNVNTFLSSV